MDVFEFDLVALLFFIFGVYIIVKGRLNVTLSAGPSGLNSIVDDNHPDTKSKEVHLGRISCRIFGVMLIVISCLIYMNVKGDLLFSI
jgi:hypothetical protein